MVQCEDNFDEKCTCPWISVMMSAMMYVSAEPCQLGHISLLAPRHDMSDVASITNLGWEPNIQPDMRLWNRNKYSISLSSQSNWCAWAYMLVIIYLQKTSKLKKTCLVTNILQKANTSFVTMLCQGLHNPCDVTVRPWMPNLEQHCVGNVVSVLLDKFWNRTESED